MSNNMPDLGFKLMALTYKLVDLFSSVGEILEEFKIKKGSIVVDYGCGPGRYIEKASSLVGKNGKVYAVDIHPLAIETVENIIESKKIENVISVLAEDNKTSIKNSTADIIYALDMFHHVNEPESFFTELNRIIKDDGILYIEDGHQSREESISKLELAGLWKIVDQTEKYLKCKPVK